MVVSDEGGILMCSGSTDGEKEAWRRLVFKKASKRMAATMKHRVLVYRCKTSILHYVQKSRQASMRK